jgi:hypothetical protein
MVPKLEIDMTNIRLGQQASIPLKPTYWNNSPAADGSHNVKVRLGFSKKNYILPATQFLSIAQ